MMHVRNVLAALFLVLMPEQTALAGQPPGSAPYEERQFLKLVVGKTSAEVTDAIGAPANTDKNNDIVIWYYRNIVEAMSSKKVFSTTQLVFMNDRVSEVMNSFSSIPETTN